MPNPPHNLAAGIDQKHARLSVERAPYTPPETGRIVVRNRAVAINPLDWIIQVEGNLLYGWLKYPTILGADVCGDVVEIGPGVTRFAVGDRVLALAVGTDRDTNTGAEGAHQRYTVVREDLASPLPHNMPYEAGAVLPLAVATAASGLFQKDQLGLRLPVAGAAPTGETVLVWGGSTSVGGNAIQLAVAAGYEVFATASPRNFDYARSLGAAQVFDHHSPAVVSDIVTALMERTVAGAVSLGTTGAPACVRILARCRGRRFVAIGTPPVDFATLADPSRGRFERAHVTLRLVAANIALQASARSRGVGLKYIFGSAVKANEVGPAIFGGFLPAALADGRYRAAPRPTIVGNSLHDIQPAMDRLRAGVSAAKLVVTLTEDD